MDTIQITLHHHPRKQVDIQQTDLILQPGESTTVLVRAKPPANPSASTDEFEFTLKVTPESCEVCAQPLDLTVKSSPEKAPEWVDTALWVGFGGISLFAIIQILLNRRRSVLV